MKKILLVVSMVLILAQSAFALSAGVNAGVYVPEGDYKDTFDVGYSVGVRVEQNLFIFTDIVVDYEMLNASGKGSYSNYDLQGHNIDLMLKFAPIPIVIDPYIALGGTYSINNIKGDNNDFTQDGFGFVAEAGLGFNILIVNIGLKAKYRSASVSGGSWSSQQADSITGGAYVTVKIPFI